MAKPKEDPIFAAIKTWRKADKLHLATFMKEHGLELGEPRPSDRTCRAYHQASGKMARTVPTTRAGASALSKWLLRDIKMGEAPWHAQALASIHKFLKG